MKSDGQKVLEAWAGWISSWVVFTDILEGQALIAALWAMHTWFVGRGKFPVTAYAHITSDGPGCGKSTAMEVEQSLSRAGRFRPTMRCLSVVRDIEENKGEVTYFFDQVEALQSTKINDELSILLSGYKDGGEHGVSVGTKQVAFSTYCAKMFACIGDVHRDLRTRVILWRLSYGNPARSWTDSVMVRGAEAASLRAAAERIFGEGFAWVPEWRAPDFMQGREREIWSPLWSVALALGLDGPMLARVKRAMLDMAEFKRTAAAKSYRDLAQVSGTKDQATEYAERLLRDLARVMPEATKIATGNLHTESALAALRDSDGPWRVFEGRGLDAGRLAALLERYGVKPDLCREVKGRKGTLRRGYNGDVVRLALAKLDAGTE